MSKETAKGEKHYLKELKEMVRQQKKAGEPAEKVFPVFCHRHGISMDECRKYYDKIAAEEKDKK